ncbi:hypothetical protein RHS02_06218, partial [Rhizoctonia solani]
MSANGEVAATTAPSFENFSFSFSKPSLLSRLNMNATADSQTEPSATAGPISAITSDSNSNSDSRTSTLPSSAAHSGQEIELGLANGTVIHATNSSGSGFNHDSVPRVATPTAMEIDNETPEIEELPFSRASPNDSRIPASYHNLPANHYFVAPPIALPYPRSPVRRFSEGHPLHTQPSLFGYLPRAPPRSPRLDPLEVLELESARERNEWEQVRQDLGQSRVERPPNIAPASDDDYDSDSSDVELRIYNADPTDETHASGQSNSVTSVIPPTPLGARPPVVQSQAAASGSAAHRSIIQRLSQGPTTLSPPSTSGGTDQITVDRGDGSPRSTNTTPAKRKFQDVEHNVQGPNAQRNSPIPQLALGAPNTRTGVPPPLRAEVDRIPVAVSSSTAPQTLVNAEATRVTRALSQSTTPQPIVEQSSSSTVTPVAKSGNICRFHNRPPGRVCVRKEQCPDIHIGELQRSVTPANSAPTVEQPLSSGPPPPPPTTAPPEGTAPLVTRTPSLADAPPLGTNPSPPPVPTRTPCRYFSRRGGCARGVHCKYLHGLNGQTRTGSGASTSQSQPSSRQTAPMPPTSTTSAPTPAPTPAVPVAIPGHAGPKPSKPAPPVPALASATAGSLMSTPTLTVQHTGTSSRTVPAPVHPLPPRPPSLMVVPPESPKAQSKTKGKGKGKAAAQGGSNPTNTNKSGGQANAKVKVEQDASVPNTKAAKRKASGSQPRPHPQPTRIDTATREIKQEEVTLYDLAGDSPSEPSGPSILPPEISQSQTRAGATQTQSQSVATQQAQAQTQPRVEAAQSQPRPIAPLPSRAVAPATKAPTPPTGTTLTPLNRPPPPPYRPPPTSNPSSTALAQGVSVPNTTRSVSATTAPAIPTKPPVPSTAVAQPLPARPAPEQSVPRALVTNLSNGSTTSAPSASKAPVSNPSATQASNASTAPAPKVHKTSIPAPIPVRGAGPTNRPATPPPRPNLPPAPPRPNMVSPPQGQAQSQPKGREPARRDTRRDSPEPIRRNTRKNSREPERRSLMTRMNSRKAGGDSYRPMARSRSPPPRRLSPLPPRGRSPSPGPRYRDWRSRPRSRSRSRSRSPVRRPLRERFAARARSRSRSWSPARYSLSPIRSPMYRSPRSSSRSFSRSRSRSPPRRQRYEPRAAATTIAATAPVDGYTNGSAYFPPEKNIPRAWEPETGGSRTAQNKAQESVPSDTMTTNHEPIRSSTPPSRTAMTALNDYDSFNQSRAMDISPMSSPARGYTARGLENRLSDYPESSANDHYTSMGSSHPAEPRENLLARMNAEPDLANRLAPAALSNRGQVSNRGQPVSKATRASKPQAQQAPLANRLGGGEPFPSQASRSDRREVLGGRLMGRMTGQ